MGFTVHINNFLRIDVPTPLVVEKEYPFAKNSLTLIAGDIQIWL
jgi:hypothetical protein